MPSLIGQDLLNSGGTWTSSSGTPTIVSAPAPPSALNSLLCDANNDRVTWQIADVGYTRLVLACWINFASFPGSVTRVFKIDAGLSEGWVAQQASGQPSVSSDGTPTITRVFSGVDYQLNTWYWTQVMYDVSANPWEVRLNANGTVVANTGAAAASNLDAGNFTIGNTGIGDTITVYYGHIMMGVAADDNDWFAQPSFLSTVRSVAPVHSRGVSW